MPRAADAYATADKWQASILAAVGHGEEWARVFHAGPHHSQLIWAAIAAAVVHAPVSVVHDRAAHGVGCGVDITVGMHGHDDRGVEVPTRYPAERRVDDRPCAPMLWIGLEPQLERGEVGARPLISFADAAKPSGM